MSAAAVEMVGRLFTEPAFDAAAVERWHEDFWATDIDYRAIEGAPDDHGPIRGRDAMRAYFTEWLTMFENARLDLVEVADAGGDLAIATLDFSGRDRRHGVEMTPLRLTILYTVRDGRVVRGREFMTRDEALAAASDAE